MARIDVLPPEIIIQILIEVAVDDMMEPAKGNRWYTDCTEFPPLMLFRDACDETDNLYSLITATERVHQVFRLNRYTIFQQLVKRLVELREPGSTDGMPANMVVYQQLLRLDEKKEPGLASALPALVSGISDEEKDTLLQSLRHTQLGEMVNHTMFPDILEAIRARYAIIDVMEWYWVNDPSCWYNE